MTVMGFPEPVAVPCSEGCGVPVVLALTSVGLRVVHCGTWLEDCVPLIQESQPAVSE